MTRADGYVRSLVEDIGSIQKRLFDLRIGSVRKVDCDGVEIGNFISQLERLKEHLPFVISNSED